jgi:RAT1-interacting protein
MNARQRSQMYYGYAFESYCTSEMPNTREPRRNPHPKDPPGWGGDVNTNVQWCSVVRTKLGDTRMIIGGEVDCVRGDIFAMRLSLVLTNNLGNRQLYRST